MGLATTVYETGCPSHPHRIFIRSCEEGQQHLEVRLGNVETSGGARQVFAAIARTDTAIETLVRRGLTEGAANFVVNRRLNKSQQMRWSRRGADLLLQVRCAGFNGKLGPSFGQLFQAADPASERARAT
jgi:hypothetical protein